MAALGEVPFGRYYGSVDATPLFVMLAARLLRAHRRPRRSSTSCGRTSQAALDWMRALRRSRRRRLRRVRRGSARPAWSSQGWKDSRRLGLPRRRHAWPSAPIALCEVQGYAYAAWRGAASWRATLGENADAAELRRAKPSALRQRFEDAFWCEELGTYALALDGNKQPCRVRSSNAGHALFTGIAAPERARAASPTTLMAGAVFSGWGIRTIAARRGALQPDVLSQRLGLAARQRADRRWASRATACDEPLARPRPACSTPRRTSTCTACPNCSAASAADPVRADPLSGRVHPAGLGRAVVFALLGAMPRPILQSPPAADPPHPAGPAALPRRAGDPQSSAWRQRGRSSLPPPHP